MLSLQVGAFSCTGLIISRFGALAGAKALRAACQQALACPRQANRIVSTAWRLAFRLGLQHLREGSWEVIAPEVHALERTPLLSGAKQTSGSPQNHHSSSKLSARAAVFWVSKSCGDRRTDS